MKMATASKSLAYGLMALGVVMASLSVLPEEKTVNVPLRIQAGYRGEVEFRPRAHDAYEIQLVINDNGPMKNAILNGRPNVIGAALVGSRRREEGSAASAVRMTWSAVQGGRVIARGQSRDLGLGWFSGNEAFRRLGSVKARPWIPCVVAVTVDSTSGELNALAPHVRVVRNSLSAESEAVAQLLALVLGIVLGCAGGLTLALTSRRS